MTPFDRWYSANIAPTLPVDAPPEVLTLSRNMAASIWNAALEAVISTEFKRTVGASGLEVLQEINTQILALRVTP